LGTANHAGQGGTLAMLSLVNGSPASHSRSLTLTIPNHP
jgi:hypothetical protein